MHRLSCDPNRLVRGSIGAAKHAACDETALRRGATAERSQSPPALAIAGLLSREPVGY